jgi:hypothetical protein
VIIPQVTGVQIDHGPATGDDPIVAGPPGWLGHTASLASLARGSFCDESA